MTERGGPGGVAPERRRDLASLGRRSPARLLHPLTFRCSLAVPGSLVILGVFGELQSRGRAPAAGSRQAPAFADEQEGPRNRCRLPTPGCAGFGLPAAAAFVAVPPLPG